MQIRYLLKEVIITMKSNEILTYFNDSKIHHIDELYCFLLCNSSEPAPSKETLRRSLNRLKNQGDIYLVSKNIYAKGKKQPYEPEYDIKLKRLNNFIRNQYSEIDFIVWDTSWLKIFSHNYYMTSYRVVEVEKGFEETIFNYVKSKYPSTFLNPTEKEYEMYIDSPDAIIIKSLLKRAPVLKSNKGNFPKIEKLIVDTYIEKAAFNWLQGIEWKRMLNNMIDSCEIDMTTLINYSLYRKNKQVLENFYSTIKNYRNDTDHINQFFNYTVGESSDSIDWKAINSRVKENLIITCFKCSKNKVSKGLYSDNRK